MRVELFILSIPYIRWIRSEKENAALTDAMFVGIQKIRTIRRKPFPHLVRLKHIVIGLKRALEETVMKRLLI